MSKYCRSCGATNLDTASVCSRCGKVLPEGKLIRRPIPIAQKYQVWSIVMFVYAGISASILILMFNEFSKNEWQLSLMSYKQQYSARNQMYGEIIGGILMIIAYIHCGILLCRTDIRRKGVFIFYEIVFGLAAMLDVLLIFLIMIASLDEVSYALETFINLAFMTTSAIMLYLKSSRRTVYP